jgi:hypothetical protein
MPDVRPPVSLRCVTVQKAESTYVKWHMGVSRDRQRAHVENRVERDKHRPQRK